jgi:hypothetical protein
MPLREYPSPDESTVETVMAASVAVRDPFFETLFPTATLPNATVAGVTESCPLGLLAAALGAGARLHPANMAVVAITNPNK